MNINNKIKEVSKRKIGLAATGSFLSIVAVGLMGVLLGSSVFANSTAASSSEFNLSVDEVIALDISSPCDSAEPGDDVSVTLSSIGGGVMSSCPNIVTVNTNTTGFQLLFRANNANLVNVTDSSLTIPSTNNTTPSTLAANAWGYGIPATSNTNHSTVGIPSAILSSFDNSYTNRNNSSPIPADKYAKTPTTNYIIKEIHDSNTTIVNNKTEVFYGSTVDVNTAPGKYKTTITYTLIGDEPAVIPTTCENSGKAPECIAFTVDVGTTGTYSIPTSGRVANMDHTYDWDVYINGELTTNCPSGNCTGTSSTSSTGIALTGLANGTHQIKILPHGNNSQSTSGSIPGWGNAFGHNYGSPDPSKLISLDQPLTTMAFAPKTTESTTNASYMFANIFQNCSNLTTPATIIDTYKLPDTITDLSYFIATIHFSNTSLTSPIDLSQLSSWFNNNTSITNLDSFLDGVHCANTNLTSPIDLTPLSGWFNTNTPIAYLSAFLYYTHYQNTNLTSPIDMTPLSGWFNNNTSLVRLGNFLSGTHFNNTSLKLTGQTILPNWIKTIKQGNTNILNVSGTFSQTYYVEHTKYDDTGEIRFQDGTVLSSLGAIGGGGTYANRSGIIPVNSEWK
jgi:hypothetical protein